MDQETGPKPQDWIYLLADLFAGEVEQSIPGFPKFDEYVEIEGGGWGTAGKCALCSEQAPKITKHSHHCFPCAKMEWGVAWGEYNRLVKLGRHLYEVFYWPVLRWLGIPDRKDGDFDPPSV